MFSGTVTGVIPQQRRGRRCNVFLDGRYAFSLHADLATRLQVGQELTDVQADELVTADQHQRALEAAWTFLAHRPRSETEVRRRLQAHFAGSVIESVLARLRQGGLLDDEQFARYWVEQRRTFRPSGSRTLRQELAQKGLQAETIAEATSELQDELALAYRAASSKARTLDGADFNDFQRRLGAFLARRGFDWETTRHVTRQLWNERSVTSGE